LVVRVVLIQFSFDVAAWIKNNVTDSDKNKTSSSGPGLKIAGAEGMRKEDEGIGVMMAMDKDEMTQRLERDAQAEIKRQQNAMPSWHLKSTITGELTALGIKENAREVSAMTNGNEQTSNDNILKGLGVIGGGSSRTTAGQSSSRVAVIPATPQEDVKPIINPESDRMQSQFSSSLFHFQLNISSV
jgi:transcription initiation factor TFIIE subunit alpha